MRHIVCILLVLIFQPALAQKDSLSSLKKLSVVALMEDFDILTNALSDIHPSLNQYISKEALFKKESDIREKLNKPKTMLEMYALSADYLKEIRCGHTVIIPSEKFYVAQRKDLALIPLAIYVKNEKLYIRQSLQKEVDIPLGAEILQIDNMPVKEIWRDLEAIMRRDGYSTNYRDYLIEAEFSSLYLMLYDRKDKHTVVFLHENETDSVVLKSGEPEKLTVSNKKDSTLYSIVRKGVGMNYFHFGNSSLSLIDIDAFSRGESKKYFKNVFKDLAESNAQNLVLDLRGNGGGVFMAGAKLLKYLMKEDFSFDFYRNRKSLKKNENVKVEFGTKLFVKYVFGLFRDSDKTDPRRNFRIKYKVKKKYHFDGKIFVLTDGKSFSMSSNFLAKLKSNSDVTVIGAETGGNEEGCNGTMFGWLTLPNSGVRLYIPYVHMDNKVELQQMGRGILPDFPVDYSIEERMMVMDKEMKVLENILHLNSK